MPVISLPFANGFYLSESLPVSHQEAINLYPNVVQAQALNQEVLFPTPGLVQITADQGVGDEVNRGAHVMDGVPYFVNGNTLYRLDRAFDAALNETLSTTSLGTIEGSGRVWMADNGTQLCVLVPGGKGYIYTSSSGSLVEITDADFRASGDPQAVVFIDGYFLFTTDEKKHIVSALNDGLSYNALDFGSAEADPDEIVAPIVFRNQLFIGGSQTIEAFQNIGGADYPFQRTGIFIEKGISAPFAAVNANDTFLFIGAGKNESPAIWELQGNSVGKVSTTAIDKILQELTAEELAECFAWSYAQSGAYFVGFVLPTTVLVYDVIAQRWHERKSYIVDYNQTPQTVRNRVNSVVQAYGRVLVGDSQDGRIGEFDRDTYTEYGEAIVRRFTTPPVTNNTRPFFVPWLELTIESGVGNADAPDPYITMYQSKDGRTWSDGIKRRMGKVGEYTKRCIWRRLGRIPRHVVYRFDVSDPVKFVAIQLVAEIEGED